MKSEYEKAVPCFLSKQAITKIAEEMAKKLDYNPEKGMNPVLDKIGGRLKIRDFWDLSNDSPDSIEVHDVGDFDIYVSSTASQERDRFTIAHEIGHYVLHFLYPRVKDNNNKINKMYATRYGTDRGEWEANWFAVAFLMQEEDFRQRFNRLEGDLEALSDELGVSKKAVDTRANVLGLSKHV